jgi:hypothetical protein
VPRNEFQSIIQGIEEQMLLTQLCNPGEGSRVPRLQCYQARFQGFAGFQDSTVAGFESSKVPEFKIAGVLGFQGSRFQEECFQTCKRLGLIHQQRNDQRHAKQMPNTL